MMLEVFGETLPQFGVEPFAVDTTTGSPVYRVEDIARAIGIPLAELNDSPPPSLTKTTAPEAGRGWRS